MTDDRKVTPLDMECAEFKTRVTEFVAHIVKEYGLPAGSDAPLCMALDPKGKHPEPLTSLATARRFVQVCELASDRGADFRVPLEDVELLFDLSGDYVQLANRCQAEAGE